MTSYGTAGLVVSSSSSSSSNYMVVSYHMSGRLLPLAPTVDYCLERLSLYCTPIADEHCAAYPRASEVSKLRLLSHLPPSHIRAVSTAQAVPYRTARRVLCSWRLCEVLYSESATTLTFCHIITYDLSATGWRHRSVGLGWLLRSRDRGCVLRI